LPGKDLVLHTSSEGEMTFNAFHHQPDREELYSTYILPLYIIEKNNASPEPVENY
jgi:hypothetical protein